MGTLEVQDTSTEAVKQVISIPHEAQKIILVLAIRKDCRGIFMCFNGVLELDLGLLCIFERV